MYWRPLTFCLNWNVLKIISLRKLEWFCTCQKTVERQLKKGDGSICNNVNATDNTEISPIACTVETLRPTLAVGIQAKFVDCAHVLRNLEIACSILGF